MWVCSRRDAAEAQTRRGLPSTATILLSNARWKKGQMRLANSMEAVGHRVGREFSFGFSDCLKYQLPLGLPLLARTSGEIAIFLCGCHPTTLMRRVGTPGTPSMVEPLTAGFLSLPWLGNVINIQCWYFIRVMVSLLD